MSSTSTVSNRVYFLDAARAVMLLMGIPFHVSEIYRISNGYAIDSPDASYLASSISAAVHVFRMPAFFLLSGYFAAMLLKKGSSDEWMKGRTWKLGIPLIATTIILGSFENGLALYFNDGLSWSAAWNSAIVLPISDWVHHRWFLVVLLMYCGTLAVIHPHLDSRFFRKSDNNITGFILKIIFLVILIILPFLAIILGKIAGEWFWNVPTLKQYANLYTKYAVFFASGYWIYRAQSSFDNFLQFKTWELPVALCAVIAYFATYFAFYPEGSAGAEATMKMVTLVRVSVECLAGLYAAKLFYIVIRSLFNRRSQTITYFVDASFCIYLVHEIFLLAIGGSLLNIGLNIYIEMTFICVLTLFFSVVSFEIVKRSTFLSVLFNGGPVSSFKSTRVKKSNHDLAEV